MREAADWVAVVALRGLELSVPLRREHIVAALAVLVVLVAAAAGCSGSTEEGAAKGAPASADLSTTAPADATLVPPAETAPVDPSLLEEARDHLGPVVAELSVGGDVEECVVHRAATGGRATDGVSVTDRDTWGPVLDVVSECTHMLVAAPAFAAEQQRAAGGTLTTRQLACLRDGYAGLGPDVAEDLAAGALSGDADAVGSAARLDELLAGCGVPVDR